VLQLYRVGFPQTPAMQPAVAYDTALQLSETSHDRAGIGRNRNDFKNRIVALPHDINAAPHNAWE
jgi:hypothetical protein